MRAPDDAASFGAEYQAELREFEQKAQASGINLHSRVAVFDSPSATGGLTGEFLIPLAQIVVPALTAVAVAWITKKNGRKLRLKVGDVELEGNTKEDIDLLVAKAKELAPVVDSDENRGDCGRHD